MPRMSSPRDSRPALVRDITPLREATDCLADEIAIDFPSMDPLVDRMRQPFLAGEASVAELVTELRLSHREALDGITIPLDVPLECACPSCGGRGETWMEPCRRCRGSGTSRTHHRVHVSLPAGVSHGDRFVFSVTTPYARPASVELRIAVTV